MRYFQVADGESRRLMVQTRGTVYDLTTAKEAVRTFEDLLSVSANHGQSLDEFCESLLEDAEPTNSVEMHATAVPPVAADEIWAAGVTYQISEEAREAESSKPDIYLDVYDSTRPELFFKATPDRFVGPNEKVGIRADSTWDVPEPELGVVLHQGEIVGYTVGNDMSSRSLEGENPLYLPQAKVYDRCCAIGPCVRSAESIDDPHDLEMSMRITRDEKTLYDDSTTTAKMVRSISELVEYYARSNPLPDLSVLLTGTSLVPDESFTLAAGDVIDIEIEEIGTLRNTVTTV